MPEPPEPAAPLAAAFRSPEGRRVAVVLINPDKAAPRAIAPRVTGPHPFRLREAFVTDRRRGCEPAEWEQALPPQSVTTLLYEAD